MSETIVGDHWSIRQMAEHLDAHEWNVRQVVRKLGLGFVVGRTRVLSEADIPAIEIGIKMIRRRRQPAEVDE